MTTMRGKLEKILPFPARQETLAGDREGIK